MLGYWHRYDTETLGALDPASIYRDLTLSGTRQVVLCCYERPEEFCHRHIVAHWFTQAGLPAATEYGVEAHTVFGG